MSASREKKTRLGQTEDTHVKKTAYAEAKSKEDRRSSIVYRVVAVVFVIVAIAAIIWKTNAIPKLATAVTIGEEKYNAAEVSFYYQNSYQSFVSQNYSYLSYFGLDTGKDLKEQAYGSDGKTWYDYFMDEAVNQMVQVQALYEKATGEGFTWTDELQQQLDSHMESVQKAAANYGYSTKQYLAVVFGAGMTEKVYREQMQRTLLADAYMQDYQDSLTYTDAELEEAYQATPDAYDKVSYEVVRISGAADSKDADGNDIEVTEEMTAAAMAQAKEKADTMYAAWQAGGDLSELAEADEKAAYTESGASGHVDSVLMNWLFDKSRTAGDSAVLQDDSTSTCYVVLFRERFRENYNSVNVRHILIQPAATTLEAGSDGYEADVAAKKAEAEKKAEDLLAQWKGGEATEESFAQLAIDNSQDGGSASAGGLYRQIQKGWAVGEFNDWCFDASRKSGDTGIVYNEATGYHVMYFVGTDLPYWQVLVKKDLSSEDVNEWYSAIVENYSADQHSFGLQFVG